MARRRTLYFWTMVGFPVVSFFRPPGMRSRWPRELACHVQDAMHGSTTIWNVPRLTSAYVAVHHHAGALSLSAKTVSYETQDVRAFGLVLSDLSARMNALGFYCQTFLLCYCI